MTAVTINPIRAAIFSLILAVLASFSLGIGSAQAQLALPAEEPQATVEVVAPEAQPTISSVESAKEDFVHQAQAGDNLTLLARRSLQLYLDAQAIDFSTGQLIAAETCVVKQSGSFQLEIGQQVVLSSELIETCAKSSRYLDQQAVTRWAAYGPIRQNLDDIQPVAVPSYVQVTTTETSSNTDGDQPGLAEVTQADQDQNSGQSLLTLGVIIIIIAITYGYINKDRLKRGFEEAKRSAKKKK